MPERRRNPRLRKRLPVVFDDGKQTRVGFSINFSVGGLSIGSTHALPPGTAIKGKFTTREGQEVGFEATVQWSRQIQGMPGVPAQNTMGLSLVRVAASTYEGFLRELQRGKAVEEPYVGGAPHKTPAPATDKAGDDKRLQPGLEARFA